MIVLEKFKSIRGIIFDVDGVMTGGQLLLTEEGKYLRTFNIRDGYAIRRALDAGLLICVISGGNSEGVERRLRDLGLADIYLGTNDKKPVLEKWIRNNAIQSDQLAYMGDDILDKEGMEIAGVKACPSDAVPEIKSIANYISPLAGGMGCVRDLIENILKAQDRW